MQQLCPCVPEELTEGNPWAAQHTSAEVVRQEMWFQSYATGIDQAVGEVVKTPLS